MVLSTLSVSIASQLLQTQEPNRSFWNTTADTSANPLPYRSEPSTAGF